MKPQIKKYGTVALAGAFTLLSITSNAQTKKPVAKKPIATKPAAKKPVATTKPIAPTSGFKNLGDGLESKLLHAGAGTKSPVFQDAIELHLIQKIGDSIVYNSYINNQGKPISIVLQPPSVKGDLVNGLTTMKEGDSTLFRLPLDTMAIRLNQPKPEWSKPGDYLSWTIKLVKIKTAEEVALEKKAQEDAMRQQQEAAAANAKAQAATDDLLIAEYLKNKGVTNFKKTESGLYYVIHQEGTGEQPKSGQKVTVNYTGVNMMGETFDSNVDPKFNHVQPFQFDLGMRNVIVGWDEGIALLRKGAKATLYIPSGMAYGPNARGPQIPANAVLIFDVELVDFQ